MTININRRNVAPIEVGIGFLIVGIVVVTVLATVSGSGAGRTADPGELRACIGRGVRVVSHLYGFSDAHTAARAVVGRDLDCETHAGKVATEILRPELAGALSPPTTPGSYTFMRIAAWGHTIAHRPQSMQMSGSQIGISAAIRFS